MDTRRALGHGSETSGPHRVMWQVTYHECMREVIFLHRTLKKRHDALLSVLFTLFALLLLSGCGHSAPQKKIQDDLLKPTEIVIYMGITKYSYSAEDPGYQELFEAINVTWLSERSLIYRTMSAIDYRALHGMTRLYFIYSNPVEWEDGQVIEEYKGYCFFIPRNMKVDGEFIGFTDESIIGTDAEMYTGPRYYEYAEDIVTIIGKAIEAHD